MSSMETLSLLQNSSAYPHQIKISNGNTFCLNRNASLAFPRKFPSQKLSIGLRKSVIGEARKGKNEGNKKEDTHSFVSKPDEATGPFPEAVLLKKKKVQEDGQLLPEFADAEEAKLYESLNLELESQWKLDSMRHYEVVYMIHEKHAEQVESVNEKVQEFIRQRKGRIWRISDWGMRRLAYKIQKAKNAHYMLMNFELEAQCINDFKTMLDKDERIIRHLVIKRDEAITEDCPPPPEFHSIRRGGDDEEDDLDDDDDEDWDDDDEGGEMEGDEEDGIIIVDHDDEDNDDDRNNDMSRKLIREKVVR
ncbi:protein REGULATOR OF FATTY ACID COMPOSITION 3, chloroplastic-like [Euphorbia lathyris]|uniref:protein REGULATOR OF FATTY ACID COMPOSITION 3, chloroplastic-like n=1 Tax=Euphorbia lathyris TaxID=212925 RepID=UPI003313B130